MKHSVFLVLVFTFMLFAACKKSFLETPPSDNVTTQGYVKDLSSSNEYLNGIYIDLAEKVFSGYGAMYADITADDAKPAPGRAEYVNHYTWTQIVNDNNGVGSSPDDVNMNGYYKACYKVARNCSFLIEKVDEFRSENPGRADDIKGQLLAIRAMVHHLLVSIFAQPYKFTANASHSGIAYVTTSDYTQPLVRQSVAKVYTDIIADFDNAIQLLAADRADRNFISRDAAKALLARVYLFMNNYENAKRLSLEVLARRPIMSREDYPVKLFTPEDSETLFSVSACDVGYLTLFSSLYYRRSRVLATGDLAGLLTESANDRRSAWVTSTSGNWVPTKFPVGVVPYSGNPFAAYVQTVIRTSEVCLTAAEAYAKMNREDSAHLFLDAIRMRADSTASKSDAIGTALLESIYKERRKELCFENMRMFDLLRMGKDVIRTDPDVPDGAKRLAYPSPKAIAPIHLLDIGYYGLTQNPGY